MAIATLACAAPIHAQPTRPRVGVAFGGGSARGLAHIGVVRWFEEHHVPIDVAAGTSMGGLVGGGFAAGMSADELRALIADTDWDAMFGSSSFRLQERAAEGGRARLSVTPGVRAEARHRRADVAQQRSAGGFPPVATSRAGYPALDTFDELPTPFRAVAVDLRTASAVVIDRGSLARGDARDDVAAGRLSAGGGRRSRARRRRRASTTCRPTSSATWAPSVVIAINVGDLPTQRTINYSMFGLLGQHLDAMMRANTRRALQAADVDHHVPTSRDSARSTGGAVRELIEQGYKAAEASTDRVAAAGGRRRGVADVDRGARSGAGAQALPSPHS